MDPGDAAAASSSPTVQQVLQVVSVHEREQALASIVCERGQITVHSTISYGVRFFSVHTRNGRPPSASPRFAPLPQAAQGHYSAAIVVCPRLGLSVSRACNVCMYAVRSRAAP